MSMHTAGLLAYYIIPHSTAYIVLIYSYYDQLSYN